MPEEILKQILSELVELKDGQNEIKEDVVKLKEDVNRIEAKVDRMDAKVNRMEAKLDGPFNQVVLNTEGITQINQKFDRHASLLGRLNTRVTIIENENIGAQA